MSASELPATTTPGPARDAEWDQFVEAEHAAEEELTRRSLTIPQALELARLHVIEGRTAREIAARWPDWDEAQVKRAFRTRRFQAASDHLQRESATLAGRLIARLNVAADETIDRIVRIAQGQENAGHALDKNGDLVPVPFSEKTQWDALRWHAERVLPPVKSDAPGAGGPAINIYNQTNYMAAMQHLSDGVTKLSALFGGDPGRLPAVSGSGGVSGDNGNVAPGSPPSNNMFSFIKQGAAQLVQRDDEVVIPEVPPA